MDKNKLWYLTKDSYDMYLQTQKAVFLNEALDYYYKYKREGGKRRLDGLEGRKKIK